MDIGKLIAVVESLATAVIPGAQGFVAVGAAVLELVKSVRPTLSSTDQAALDAALPALLLKMNHDVDQAMIDLRGG